MDLSLVAQFWVIGMLLTLTPGADWAYVIGAGLRARSVAPSVFGLVAGYALIITAVALGVGAVLARVPAAMAALTFAGALYLLYLGFGALLSPGRQPPTGEAPAGVTMTPPAQAGSWGQFFRGVGLSSINPKGFLLLIALLPQFTSATSGWSPATQMLTMGAIQLLNLTIVYLAVGLLARRMLGSRPRAKAIISKVSGGLMILIGLSILVEQWLHVA